jgi:transcriptional regulator of acetoin/glycerol metabolism
LKESKGSRTLAAKKLGMSRRTLYRKLELHKLESL